MDRTHVALLLLLLYAALPITSSFVTGAPRHRETLFSWLFTPREQLDVSNVLPTARPAQPWPYRSTAAAASLQITDTHALEATVSHSAIPHVTTEMLVWWFTTIDGNGTYPGDGQQWPKYLMWHPRDHIYQTTLAPEAPHTANTSPTAAASAAAAAAPLWEICEFFQCSNPDGYTAGSYPGPQATRHELLIKAVTVVKQLGSTGLWLSVPSSTGLGETFWNLRHSWADTPDGVVVNSSQVVGVVEPAWRPLWFARGRNAIIRGMFGRGRDPQQILRMWMQHCIEEMGNLEHILPSLYAEAQHGSSRSSRSSRSNSLAAATGSATASKRGSDPSVEVLQPEQSGSVSSQEGAASRDAHDEL